MSRRLLALLVGGLVLGLLIAAPILSSDEIAQLNPEVRDDGTVDVGSVRDVHENLHVRPIILQDDDVAVFWFDPRWDGARDRFAGHVEWQPGEGITAARLVDPETGERAIWCITSALFEVASNGAAFNDLGERVAGPGATGLERHPIRFVDDRVLVDTTVVLPGPAVEGRLGYAGARGPRCVSIDE